MKQYLKANVIKNISLNITTDGLMGDIVTNSFNSVNRSHVNYRDSATYRGFEYRKFSTVYSIFKGSGFVTGKLLLMCIIKNFRLRGLDIETINDSNAMKRYYKVSIEVKKFIDSFDDMKELITGDNCEIPPDTLLLQFTKIGLLFDDIRHTPDIGLTAQEFLWTSKVTIEELANANRDLNSISTNKMLGLILRAINLIFGFAMIPVETIEINEVLSSMVLEEDEHSPCLEDHPEHHIFSKVLYGFELFDSIENLLNLKSDKSDFTNKLKRLIYDPYSNKYTSKTLVNYSSDNATSYLISKRDFHRTNSISYSLFSYDQLVKHKSYENKGDLSIKKLMDPPVYIYKYGEEMKKYDGHKVAVLNIYTNALAVPSDVKRDPILIFPNIPREITEDLALATITGLVNRFVSIDKIMDDYDKNVNRKKIMYNSSLEAIHNWSINIAILDKIKCLKSSDRRLRSLLVGCVTYTVDATMNSCIDASLERKIMAIVDNKSFIPKRFNESRILKDILLDCRDLYIKNNKVNNKKMVSIVSSTIMHISAIMRSPVAATLFPSMLPNIINTIMGILEYDTSTINYRRRNLKLDLFSKSEYFLVQGFGKGIFPCSFIGPGVLDMKDLSDYLQYHIMRASTTSYIER